MEIYTVYDQAAEAYLDPFFTPSAGLAIRAFTDAVNSKSHQFGKHPQDYSLIHLGIFDNATAKFLPFDVPKHLGNGLKFLATNPAEADTNEIDANPPVRPNGERGDTA